MVDVFYLNRSSNLRDIESFESIFLRFQQELIGYIQSKMIYVESSQLWKIVDVFTNKTLAYTNDTTELPVGLHRWYFLDVECTDSQDVPWRRLNLHVKVDQPGHFCCDTGECIRIIINITLLVCFNSVLGRGRFVTM